MKIDRQARIQSVLGIGAALAVATAAASAFVTIGPSTGPSISPAKAERLLVEGNARFEHGAPNHTNAGLERVSQTASGQHPFATVIACSDSRVPVERIFDRGIGDLFVIRVAGNVAGSADVVGSVEYGIGHLETPVLLVLGHTGCGAVSAAATDAEVHGSIPQLLAPIEPAVAETHRLFPRLTGGDFINACVKVNCFNTIEALFAGSEDVRERVRDGDLRVIGGVYNLETGNVEFFGEHPRTAQLAAEPAAMRRATVQPHNAEFGGVTETE